MAPLIKDTVSWVCTPDSTGFESSTRTPRLVSRPASCVNLLEAIEDRRGLNELRRRSLN